MFVADIAAVVVDVAAVVVDVDDVAVVDVAVVDVASNGGVATENFCREKIIFHLPRVEDE